MKKQKEKEVEARIKKRLNDALKGKSRIDKYSKYIRNCLKKECFGD